MEQITREELIGLLEGLYNKLMDVTECPECCGRVGPECCGSPEPRVPDDVLQLVDKARQYAAALQAAEPVGFGLKGMLTKQWDGKTFVEKEDADSYEEAALLPLFTLPCLPARAQIPEGWGIDIGEFGEIVISAPDGEQDILYHDTPVMNEQLLYALLTASPAPGRAQELEDMAKDYREKVRSWISKALHENAEKRRLEAENAELRNRGAVYYGLQKDEGRLLMNVGTEQLEIYDSLRAAQRAVSTGQKIIRLRVRRDDEGEA